jgi:FAD:protein FMN transferase
MTMIHFKKSVVLATLFFCFLGVGCGRPGKAAQETVAFEGGIMGTTYHITVVGELDDADSQELAQRIEAALKHVDRKMSTYKPDSELSALNGSPGEQYVPVSDETFAMLELSLEVNRGTEGAFDITVGPLVNVWGFGPGKTDAPPTAEKLEPLRALVGPDKIALDGLTKSVKKAHADVYCDLSGIAKGYAVDVVATLIQAEGHDAFMVEVGGEVRCGGLNASGVPWNIAIEKPVAEGRVLQEIVGLQDMALATSGDYRNFYELDGKRISHTIDPVTGRPVAHGLASASVLHTSCALADAYATAMMVLGPERGMAVASQLNLAVMLVSHDEDGGFVTKYSDSFKRFIVDRS